MPGSPGVRPGRAARPRPPRARARAACCPAVVEVAMAEAAGGRGGRDGGASSWSLPHASYTCCTGRVGPLAMFCERNINSSFVHTLACGNLCGRMICPSLHELSLNACSFWQPHNPPASEVVKCRALSGCCVATSLVACPGTSLPGN